MAETKECPFPAIYSYKWGELGEVSYACIGHATQLFNLCQHMGWKQTFERLPAGVFKQCEQQLLEDDPIFVERSKQKKEVADG